MRVAPGRSSQCVRELCTRFGFGLNHKCVAYVGGLFGMVTCFLGRSPRVWMTSLAVVGREGPGSPCMSDVLPCMSVSVCPYLRYSLQCRVREAGSCWSLQSPTRAFILWQRPNVEARDTIEWLSSSLLVLHKATGSSHSPETPSGHYPACKRFAVKGKC